jgi:molecular chaperone GrpE
MSKKAKKTNTKEEQNVNVEDPQIADQVPENTKGEDTSEKLEEAEAQSEEAEKPSEEEKAEKSEQELIAEKIASLEASSKEWHDKYLRLSAEFDNYRKRTLKEKTELLKTANEEVLVELLSVVDDFERAIASVNDASEVSAIKEGIDLIYTKFTSFISQKGIKEIEAKEKDFDVDHHEAITKIPAPSEELKGKVVDVVQKGYTLNEKVVRFAKVVIGE